MRIYFYLNRIISFSLFIFLFFLSVNKVKGAYVCTGHYMCARYSVALKLCDNSDILYTEGCPGTNEADCEGGVGYSFCIGQCYVNETCSWDYEADPCTCSWGSYGSCDGNSTNTACIKYRTCTCDPVGCGSCTGSNWTTCTASELGCTVQSCPTYEGYTGGSVRDGTLNGDCTCGMKTCPPICTATNPDAPVLSNPASGTIVNVNTSVNLDWNAISSWGTGCPQSNKYQVCVMSDSTCDLLNWVDVASTETIKAWTPTSADSLVTWKVRSNNGSNTAESLTRTLRVNAPPTLNLSPTNYLVLQNSVATVVAPETGNRNHICQTIFTNPPATARQIKLVVTATDVDGGSDIASVSVRLNASTTVNSAGTVTGNWSLVSPVTSSVGGNNKIYTFHMSLGSGLDSGTLYNLEAFATDIWGATSGWIDSGRDFKVWDCQVLTSGTLFKATNAVQSCPTIGFTDPIDVGVSFNSIIFSGPPDISITDDDLDSYGTNNVTWGKNYLPLINGGDVSNIDGDLLATGRVTRIIDIGTGTTICPGASQFTIGNSIINPYSLSPQAQVDFSFIRDQEAWYQVVGAGVKSRNRLEYGVPVTAPVVSRFLTLSSVTNGNGLVSGIDFENKNGNNLKNDIGSPNNWYVLRNTNDLDIYNYNYFYNDFFVKAGVGVTGTDWAEKPENGIYLVKNSLNITSDFVLVDTTKTMMVIVNGDITIQPNVTQLDGIYVADGSINVGGISDNQLNINGMLYAGGSVGLYRSFTDKTDNNTTPAVKVNYSPGLIFNLPPKILRVLSGWREE